jgi:hypothetical protein
VVYGVRRPALYIYSGPRRRHLGRGKRGEKEEGERGERREGGEEREKSRKGRSVKVGEGIINKVLGTVGFYFNQYLGL